MIRVMCWPAITCPRNSSICPTSSGSTRNHESVFRAVKDLKELGVSITVVCTGFPSDHRYISNFVALWEQLSHWNIRDQIIYLGLVPHEDVLRLIRQAICVVNPSRFEGWGIAVDEARSVGKRVIASNVPSHLEQNTDKALYFDPRDQSQAGRPAGTGVENVGPGTRSGAGKNTPASNFRGVCARSPRNLWRSAKRQWPTSAFYSTERKSELVNEPPRQRTALIYGVSGQDSAWLAKLLLDKDYRVVGTSRDADIATFANLVKLGIRERVTTMSSTPTDFRSVIRVLLEVEPDEIYNLSGQTSVALSFQQPAEALDSIAFGTLKFARGHPPAANASALLQRLLQRMLWRQDRCRRREHPFPAA